MSGLNGIYMSFLWSGRESGLKTESCSMMFWIGRERRNLYLEASAYLSGLTPVLDSDCFVMGMRKNDSYKKLVAHASSAFFSESIV